MKRAWVHVIAGLGLALAATAPVSAQEWDFDPSVLFGDSRVLLQRAPDREIDQLLQALHASAQQPDEAAAMCAAFDPAAGPAIDALQTAASQLGDASRERFALAISGVLVAAAQHPPQAFDERVGAQALKAAGATAAILNDGFIAGLNGDEPRARCRAVGQLLDGLQTRPLPERAAATRLLLLQGLARLAP